MSTPISGDPLHLGASNEKPNLVEHTPGSRGQLQRLGGARVAHLERQPERCGVHPVLARNHEARHPHAVRREGAGTTRVTRHQTTSWACWAEDGNLNES